jgi:tetratricopeptide (TPR) repeat protein
MTGKSNEEKAIHDWKMQMWLGQESFKRCQFSIAEQKFKKALLDLESQHISDERLAMTLNNLALCYCAQGKHDKSDPLYQQALSIDESAGTEHALELAEDFFNIATHYKKQELYERAEPLYRKALQVWEEKLGDQSAEMARGLNSLGVLLCETGHCEAAIDCFKKSLAIKGSVFGSKSSEYAVTLVNLAATYCGLNRCDEADPLFDEGIHILEYTVDPGHEELMEALENYMTHLRKTGQTERLKEISHDIELFKKRNRRN